MITSSGQFIGSIIYEEQNSGEKHSLNMISSRVKLNGKKNKPIDDQIDYP